MIPFQFSLYTEYRTEISILNCSYLNLIFIECLFISKFSNYIVAASKNVRKSEKLLFFKCSESRGRAIKYRPEINIFKHLDKKDFNSNCLLQSFVRAPATFSNHNCFRMKKKYESVHCSCPKLQKKNFVPIGIWTKMLGIKLFSASAACCKFYIHALYHTYMRQHLRKIFDVMCGSCALPQRFVLSTT